MNDRINPKDFGAIADKYPVVIYADGVTDDTEALQKIINGEAYGVNPNGQKLTETVGNIMISKTLIIN